MEARYIRISEDGNNYYYKDRAMTILHRLDGPAYEWVSGKKSWYVDGKELSEKEFDALSKPIEPMETMNPEEQYIKIDKDGNKFYFKDSAMKLNHRLDGPAIENADGSKAWWVDGRRHRLDGPAFEGADGSKSWFVDGRRHRLDGPAVEDADGSKVWFVDGKHHRLDGPAVEYINECKEWYVDGRLHRLDGPAVENDDGRKEWWVDDKRHRLDGPAYEGADGCKEWWVDDKELSEKEFTALSEPVELTLEDIAAKFGIDVSKLKIAK
jgi:hypothetical protein